MFAYDSPSSGAPVPVRNCLSASKRSSLPSSAYSARSRPSAWSRMVSAHCLSNALSGFRWSAGSMRARSSAVRASSAMTGRPPPRLNARARSHSLARKCLSDASRNERNFPWRGPRPPGNFLPASAKKFLRQVLRFIVAAAAPAHVGVERDASSFTGTIPRARSWRARCPPASRRRPPASTAWRQNRRAPVPRRRRSRGRKVSGWSS